MLARARGRSITCPPPSLRLARLARSIATLMLCRWGPWCGSSYSIFKGDSSTC